jgi:hypothetical protein
VPLARTSSAVGFGSLQSGVVMLLSQDRRGLRAARRFVNGNGAQSALGALLR